MFRTKIWIVVTLLALPSGANAATPTEKCVAEKEKASGKYAQCRLIAESRFAKTGDAVKLGLSLDRCVQKLQKGFEKADLKYGLACPTSADTTTIDDFVSEASDQVVSYLGTGSPEPGAGFCGPDTEFDSIGLECLPVVTCGNGSIDGDEQCDGGDLGGASCGSVVGGAQGTLGCTAACQYDLASCISPTLGAFPATGLMDCWDDLGNPIACAGTGQDGETQVGAALSFADNGDGTVTDNVTGLTWEKLSDDGTIHDWDTVYDWDGAFGKVAALNTEPCFAGQCDWRVPNVKELLALVDYGASSPAVAPELHSGCTPGCTVLACSCTKTSIWYWSSSTVTAEPVSAHHVSFYVGAVNGGSKASGLFVRAVRGP